MSSAHYFVKNYSLKEVINLFCYNTRFPHTLTSTQKITRIYRCMLRRQRARTFYENRGDHTEFYDLLRSARMKMDHLMEISESSAQFKETIDECEVWVRNSLQPTILINECRPYSATSGKYYVFDNEDLAFDPFGYYAGAPVGDRPKRLSHLFYQNFPYDAKVWEISPPNLIDDPNIDESYSK